MSTHNLCSEHKYEKYQSFLSEHFQFLALKFSTYLNRRVFIILHRVRAGPSAGISQLPVGQPG